MSDCHPQISIWLKLEKKNQLVSLRAHTQTHTEKQAHFRNTILFGCCFCWFTT